MKNTKMLLLTLLIGTFTFFAGLLAYSRLHELSKVQYTIAVLVLLSVIFSIYIALRRMKDEKKGLPPEDELSRTVRNKSAAKAFAYSFFIWVIILIFSIGSNVGTIISIGIGILAMGVLFIGFWIYHSNKGVEDGNTY